MCGRPRNARAQPAVPAAPGATTPPCPARLALAGAGHGESGRSLNGRYFAEALAEDVKALIVALDLYIAPLAVVGCGMGAAVGLALAQASPFLVGALLAAEFTLPVAAARDAAAAAAVAEGAAGQAAAGEQHLGGRLSKQAAAIKPAHGSGGSTAMLDSRALLPWWGLCPAQASRFPSVEHCAAFPAHPLCNLSPALLLPLEAAAVRAAAAVGAKGGGPTPNANGGSSTAAAESQADDAAVLRELFGQLQRPLRGTVASACSLLRLPSGLAEGRGGGRMLCSDELEEDEFGEGGALSPRMAPSFLFSFNAAALLGGLQDLRCHLLLAAAARGSWADADDAAAMAAAAAGGAASAAATPPLPGTGHWLAADHPEELLQAIIGFLEGPAICCFERAAPPKSASSGSLQTGSPGCLPGGAPARRPELLDLKPLPQYSSLEEAQKVGAQGRVGEGVGLCQSGEAAWAGRTAAGWHAAGAWVYAAICSKAQVCHCQHASLLSATSWPSASPQHCAAASHP